MSSQSIHEYDVAIIGSGIAGGMLGSILAKHGLRTIILDAGTHPRFAVGESMIPESGVLLTILAERFGIPELRYPGNLDSLITKVGSSSAGIKLSFSFAWNGSGEEHDPKNLVSTPVLAPEAHLFRQDIDAYYVALAAKFGATIRQQVWVESVQPDGDGVTIVLRGNEEIRVRYVVDAAGYRSPVADQFKLRDGAPAMQSKTRSNFTHMVGVKGYEEAIANLALTGSPTPICQSTLHHIFDCGWLWIIPFDNHPHTTNPLCSVGLQLQIDKHGPAGDPEVEFAAFLDRHPSAKKHFEGAARVREWTRAPRINYNCKTAVGDRYCLLGHSAGFVDPLFSRGLANTFESINRLAPKILRAARLDRWVKEDFQSYDKYVNAVVAINDRLVANSYSAFKTFPLWNAWFRVWLSGSYIGVLRLRRILADYLRTRDNDQLEAAFDDAAYPGHLSIESHRYEALFVAASQAVEAFENGVASEAATVDALHELFAGNRDHLPLDFSDFQNRFVSRPTNEFAASLLDWANNAPDGLADRLARTVSQPFEFLDKYRFGDRLQQVAQADVALDAVRRMPPHASGDVNLPTARTAAE